MILASILRLEVLCGETRIAIAVPNTVAEQAPQWYFGSAPIVTLTTTDPTTAFEHSYGRGVETDIAVSPNWLLQTPSGR